MLRRVLLTVAAVIVVGGVSMSPAGAGGNYGGCSATVSDATPSAGQVVTVTGSGGADGGQVSATLDGEEVGSGTADAQGDFSFEATIPSDASGAVTLDVSCGDGRGTFPLSITVLAGSTGGGTDGTGGTEGSGDLPRTGSSSAPLVAAGLAAVAGGAVLVGVARRRSRTA